MFDEGAPPLVFNSDADVMLGHIELLHAKIR
jgi:hypothetical protein